MLTFLTLLYVGLLFLLTKTGKVPNTKTTWLTIIPYELILLLGFFIPMQWGAPTGNVRILSYSVPITPNVAGEVTEILIEANQALMQGDPLFRIDPTQYQAAYDGLKAQLALAETRLEQSRALAEQEAGSIYELQAFQAQVDGLKAQIANAEYNLTETTVRAPSDGYVTNLALRPGQRVSNLPLFRAMAFIDTSEQVLGVQIAQNFSRFVEPGQAAEVTFKSRPGKVYPATVEFMLPVTAQGQLQNTGYAAQPLAPDAGPFFVRLNLDSAEDQAALLSGSIGSAAIYTSNVKSTHVIRKVMIRMDSIMNYIQP